jgi:hypothetical protein
MKIHYCPVCGAAHEVHPTLHALAYGRQLTCSPRCKTDFPRVVCSRILGQAANDAASADKHDTNKGTVC